MKPVRALLLVAALGLVVFLAKKPTPQSPLAIYGQVPTFRFTDSQGNEFGSQELRGKVWVARYFFTSCPAQCPLVSQRLQSLEKKLKSRSLPLSDVRWVAITIDPDRDTPEKLAEYARRYTADPERWFFLTAPKAKAQALAQNGFRLGAEGEGLVHSFKLVLVDNRNQIRGYYDGLEPQAFGALERDLAGLITSSGGAALGE